MNGKTLTTCKKIVSDKYGSLELAEGSGDDNEQCMGMLRFMKGNKTYCLNKEPKKANLEPLSCQTDKCVVMIIFKIC